MSTPVDTSSTANHYPSFTIQSIPHPPLLLPSHIAQYKKIRLLSLKLDPQAFGSTYERESAFSEEVWVGRVGARGKVTFYASTTVEGSEEGKGVGKGKAKGEEEGEEEEWIGTATILYPEFILPAHRPTLPSSLIELATHEDVYLLVGMWVRPEWRRRGVGRALVLHALKHVDDREGERHLEGQMEREMEKESEGEKEGDGERWKLKVTFLDVHKANKAARGMYEDIGFRVNDESELVDQDENGTVQMYYIHDSDA